jgi:hypothetical protein
MGPPAIDTLAIEALERPHVGIAVSRLPADTKIPPEAAVLDGNQDPTRPDRLHQICHREVSLAERDQWLWAGALALAALRQVREGQLGHTQFELFDEPAEWNPHAPACELTLVVSSDGFEEGRVRFGRAPRRPPCLVGGAETTAGLAVTRRIAHATLLRLAVDVGNAQQTSKVAGQVAGEAELVDPVEAGPASGTVAKASIAMLVRAGDDAPRVVEPTLLRDG